MAVMSLLKYCPCGYPIIVDTRWNGLVEVVLFRDGRSGAEIEACPGCGENRTGWLRWEGEAIRLRPGALCDEPPRIWVWRRCEAATTCDLCRAPILQQPAPLLWDGNLVCAECFQSVLGASLEEAARQDGVRLTALPLAREGER